MSSKIQLKDAKKLYCLKKYDESLKLFNQVFNQNPDNFDFKSKVSYSWAIYQVHVKRFTDIDELYDSVDFITNLIPQSDLNRVNTCPYTFSVFKVLDYLYKEKEYYNLFDWLDLIDPELLDEKRSTFKGRIYRSRKEKYYDYVSKSNLECADWDLCIEMSKEALASLRTFTNHGDTWHRWRIARSLKELNQNSKALDYLNEVLSVKNDWFVFKEIVENYCILNEYDKALEYVPGAVLTNDPIKMKVNLYYLIYNLLKDSNHDIALKHAQLYYLLKLENNSEISKDIADLKINGDELNKKELVGEINEYWRDFKFKNQELKKFNVKEVFEDKPAFSGEIKSEGDSVNDGRTVHYLNETGFGESKSLNGVSVRGE